jgi:hypothetical protein
MMAFQQECGLAKIYAPLVVHPLRIGVRHVNTNSRRTGRVVRNGIHARIA